MKVVEYSNFSYKFFLLLIFLVILLPKINLIPIPGLTFHQEIRSDDIIILIYALFLIFNTSNLIINTRSISIKLIFFFPLFLFSLFNGYVNNINQYWIFLPRFIEYIFLIFLLENFITNKRSAIKICKYIIIINFIVILLQVNNIIGGFSSVQYYNPGSDFLARPFGLTGGAWEIGAIMSICFFIIYQFEEKKISFEILIYLFIVFYTLYLCQTRGTIFAFSFTLFFLINSNLLRLILLLLLLTGIILYFPSNDFLNKITKLNPSYILKNFLFFFENGFANEEMYSKSYYYSIAQRLDHIGSSYMMWKSNISTILFGIGFEKIYMDSFYLRILISFGLIGFCFVGLLSLIYMPFIMILFLGVAGVTLDHIFSIKIFALTIIYIHLHKNFKYEK